MVFVRVVALGRDFKVDGEVGSGSRVSSDGGEEGAGGGLRARSSASATLRRFTVDAPGKRELRSKSVSRSSILIAGAAMGARRFVPLMV